MPDGDDSDAGSIDSDAPLLSPGVEIQYYGDNFTFGDPRGLKRSKICKIEGRGYQILITMSNRDVINWMTMIQPVYDGVPYGKFFSLPDNVHLDEEAEPINLPNPNANVLDRMREHVRSSLHAAGLGGYAGFIDSPNTDLIRDTPSPVGKIGEAPADGKYRRMYDVIEANVNVKNEYQENIQKIVGDMGEASADGGHQASVYSREGLSDLIEAMEKGEDQNPIDMHQNFVREGMERKYHRMSDVIEAKVNVKNEHQQNIEVREDQNIIEMHQKSLRTELQRKYRRTKHLEKQITNIGMPPQGPLRIKYWNGDKADGNFVEVTQLSKIGNIMEYASRGSTIRGIVAQTDDDDLIIVPEERINQNEQVFVGCTFVCGTQTTGFIKFDGENTSYARVKYFNSPSWIKQQDITKDLPPDRTRKNPNRDLSISDTKSKHLIDTRKDKINEKQKAAVLDLMILHNMDISDSQHSGALTCDASWCYHRLEDASKYCGTANHHDANHSYERICLKTNDVVQDFQGYIGASAIANVKLLVDEGDDEGAFVIMWHNYETFKEMVKVASETRYCPYLRLQPNLGELKEKVEKNWSKSEQGQMINRMKDYFVLTMLYDKLSGRRRGGVCVLKAAGFHRETLQLYDVLNERKIQTSLKKSPHVLRENQCQREGCETPVHKTSGTHCYRHMDKSSVPMCIRCRRKKARKGNECHTCGKESVNVKQPPMCTECKVRAARAINSRCHVCAQAYKKCSTCGTSIAKFGGKCVKCFENDGGKRKVCNNCDKNLACRKGGLCQRCYLLSQS